MAAVTPAQARYTTMVGWQMELKQPEMQNGMVSDVLDEKGSAVRLEDMYVDEAQRDVLVNLEVSGGTVTGSLSCSVSNSYLTAQCLETAQNEANPRFTVRLVPTAGALELREKTETEITVVLNEQLWATLVVTLVPIEEQAVYEVNEEILPEEEPELAPTEPAETQPQYAEAVNFLSCMSGFDRNEYLAVQMIVPEYCDQLVLDLDGGQFPAFTRYSIDGGVNFTLLYDSAWIQIEPGNTHVVTVLLDLQNANIYNEELTLSVDAYYGDIWRGNASATTKVVTPLPDLTTGDKPLVLNEETALILGVPQDLGGATASYYLRRLDGSTDQIPIIAVDGESSQVYIEAVGADHRAKAGTYLLDINWTYQGVVAASRQIAFYVNYTSCIQEMTPASGSEAAGEAGQETVPEPTQTSEPINAVITGGSET